MNRILFLASIPYPEGTAASARIGNLAEAFRSNGWEADVLIFGRSEHEANEDLAPGIRWCVPNRWSGSLGNQYAYYVAPRILSKELKKLLEIDAYDCVYLYSRVYSVVSPLLRHFQRADIPVIIDVNEAQSHFSGFGGLFSPNYWNSYLGFRFGIPRADFIACISKELQHYYNKLGGRPLLLPAIEFYEKEPRKERTQPITFLYSGSFLERDTPATMLGLLQGLVREGLDLKFYVTGPYRKNPGASKYIQQIEACQLLGPRTSLLGLVPAQQYEELRKAADFGFILRRDHQAERASFPTRLVEYIKYGIIPISSPVPDVPDYLEHGDNAVLLQEDSLDQTVQSMRSLCADEERLNKMLSKVFAAGKRHFCAKANVERLIQILEDGSRSRPGRPGDHIDSKAPVQ